MMLNINEMVRQLDIGALTDQLGNWISRSQCVSCGGSDKSGMEKMNSGTVRPISWLGKYITIIQQLRRFPTKMTPLGPSLLGKEMSP